MIINNKYVQKKLIEIGGFRLFFKVLNNKNNKFNTLKSISDMESIEKFKKEYEKQLEIMENINNKYIINLKYNYYDEINEGFYIVFELFGEDLRKIFNKYKTNGILLKIFNKIFIQLFDILKEMNIKNYIHINLNPEGVLIKYNNQFSFNNFSINRNLFYIAPEIDKYNYNNKFHLYSLEVLQNHFYINKYIFYYNNPKEKKIIIIKEKY